MWFGKPRKFVVRFPEDARLFIYSYNEFGTPFPAQATFKFQIALNLLWSRG